MSVIHRISDTPRKPRELPSRRPVWPAVLKELRKGETLTVLELSEATGASTWNVLNALRLAKDAGMVRQGVAKRKARGTVPSVWTWQP